VRVVRISARSDYALRACIELARSEHLTSTSEAIAASQGIPHSFLQTLLGDMRRAGLVRANRRPRGGYRLACPADEISVAEIMRAMDGSLVTVNGIDAGHLHYPRSAEALAGLWAAVGANARTLLEQVSLQDVATGRLPFSGSTAAADGPRGGSEALTG